MFLCTLCLGAFAVNAQVGIGIETPDKATILDLVSNDKGMLIPRVNLTSNTLDLDGDDQTEQPEGLFVYNKGTALPEGYYYWNGVEWRALESATTIAPTITDLLCDGASLSPSAYYSDEDYTGVLRIPYTGGNGGRFSGGTSVTANGLTFTLQDNKLNIGLGELVFNVSGRPTESSPVATTFTVNTALIPFFTGTCQIKVGDQINADVKSVAIMAPLTYTSDVRAGYQAIITSPDGKFSVRAFVPSGAAFSTTNLQLRANTSSSVTILSNTTNLRSAGTNGNSHNELILPGNQWCGNGGSLATAQNAIVQNSSNNPSWGTASRFTSNMPESRYYAFTTNDGADKVFYHVRYMMGSMSDTANAAACPDGTCSTTKIFIRIEQTTAP